MTTITVTTVLDRMHEINKLVTGAQARRYFDANQTQMTPTLVPYLDRRTRNLEAGSHVDLSTRAFVVLCFVNMVAGIPSQSGMESAELMIERVSNVYLALPRLELDSAALEGVVRAELTGDGGIEAYQDEIAVVRFTIQVVTRKTFVYT